jgi:hypothetical protein
METMHAAPKVAVRIHIDTPALLAKNPEAIEVDRIPGLVQNKFYLCLRVGALSYEADPEAVLWTKGRILSPTSGWSL